MCKVIEEPEELFNYYAFTVLRLLCVITLENSSAQLLGCFNNRPNVTAWT